MVSGLLLPPAADSAVSHRVPRALGPLGTVPGKRYRYLSPLRYPGAKSAMAGIVGELLTAAVPSIGRPQMLVEPFAGGASTSLRLVTDGVVERVLLADGDPLVARFWEVAAAETEWLIDRMWSEPVTIERWEYWREWQPQTPGSRDIAMKCLFLNRTSFSGILHGRAGPIGGRRQTGRYAIDCRFNKAALETRLRLVGELYAANRIADVWWKDWRTTLADVAEWYPQLVPNRVVAYLDPPYLAKSATLYHRSFDPAGGYADAERSVAPWLWQFEHYRLAEYLRSSATYRWILSYDDDPALTSDPALYAAGRMTPSRADRENFGVRAWRISKRLVQSRYTAAASRPDTSYELLLTVLPPERVPANDRIRILP